MSRRFAGKTRYVQWDEILKAKQGGESLYDEMIDVRSPEEYLRDHISGAVNLPVLENDERVAVGTQYTENQFNARKVGAAIVCQNIGRHLGNGGHLATKEESYRPLIYCWRGGLRSRAVAEILQQVGFDVNILEGGYRSYRNWIREQLCYLPTRHKFIIVSGFTGSAKSRILELLEQHGEQIVHLERMACHKGSLLGLYPNVTEQPSQRRFDSALVERLSNLSTEKPVWLECESRSIGNLHLSNGMWTHMKDAPRIFLEVEQSNRALHIMKDYGYLIRDPETLRTRLKWKPPDNVTREAPAMTRIGWERSVSALVDKQIATLIGVVLWYNSKGTLYGYMLSELLEFSSKYRISAYHGEEILNKWLRLVENGDFESLVTDLLKRHYDPLYSRSRSRYISCQDTSAVERVGVTNILDEACLKRQIVPELLDKGYKMI